MARKPSTDQAIAETSDRALDIFRYLARHRDRLGAMLAVNPQLGMNMLADSAVGFDWDDGGRVAVRWNPDLAQSVIETPRGVVPVGVLRHLPFSASWHDLSALKIALPDNRFRGLTTRWVGFFLSERPRVEQQVRDRFGLMVGYRTKHDPNAVIATWVGYDTLDGEDPVEVDDRRTLIRMTVGLSRGDQTFDDLLQHHLDAWMATMTEEMKNAEERTEAIETAGLRKHWGTDAIERRPESERISQLIENEHYLLGVVLSLATYAASQEPDLSRRRPPESKRERQRTVEDRRRDTVVYDAGWTVGPLILGDRSRAWAEEEGTGSGKRPHIRRAHWTTVWCGPRSDPWPEARWIAPIFVNGGAKGKVLTT